MALRQKATLHETRENKNPHKSVVINSRKNRQKKEEKKQMNMGKKFL